MVIFLCDFFILVIIKSMSVKSIIFNTAFRDSGDISNPVFIIQEPLNDISSYKVRSMKLPLTQPIINNRNNKLYINVSSVGNLFTATIPSGNYYSNTIAPAVQTSINTALGTNGNVSITYSSLSNNLIIANTYATSPSLKFVDNNQPLTGENSFSAYYELGLIDYLNKTQTSFTTSNIDISGLDAVNIVSNFGNIKVNNKYKNVLDTINIDKAPLEIFSYSNNNDEYIESNTNSLSYIYFNLLDNRYRPINVDKDFSIQISFKSD